MFSMNRPLGTLIPVASLILLGAAGLQAQDARRGRGAGVGPASPEAIMSMRERLDLTEDQLAALEALRAEQVDARTSRRAAMEEMRSRLRAGQIDRAEMRGLMEELRTEAPDREAQQTRVQGILSEAQLQQLEEMRDRRQEMRRGRADMRRGSRSGMRGGRADMRRDRAGIAARGGEARAWRARVRARGPEMRPGRADVRSGRAPALRARAWARGWRR